MSTKNANDSYSLLNSPLQINNLLIPSFDGDSPDEEETPRTNSKTPSWNIPNLRLMQPFSFTKEPLKSYDIYKPIGVVDASKSPSEFRNVVWRFSEIQKAHDKWFFPIVKGSTTNLAWLEIHLSLRKKFQTPHPPHAHYDDEVIYIVDGDVKITRINFVCIPIQQHNTT